jgi:hypothetical protein
MPDVLIDFQGLRVVIEGEFESPTARDKATEAAMRRLDDGIAHMGIALIYPGELKELQGSITELKQKLADAALRFGVITEAEATQEQLTFPFPVAQPETVTFVKGDINALADSLRRAHDALAQDIVLDRAVELLQAGIGAFVGALRDQPAAVNRFSTALGIRDLPKKIILSSKIPNGTE